MSTATISVDEIKRFLERIHAEQAFATRLQEDPLAAAREAGLDWDPRDIRHLWDRDTDRELPVPEPVLAYRDLVADKLLMRGRIRSEGTPDHPRYRAWRERQMGRLSLETGPAKAEAVIHAPAAFELAVGCSVGCWFCGISAGKLSQLFRYEGENIELWRNTLRGLRQVIGGAAAWAFAYWGTDPLDNPDYELFCADMHQVLGRWPQTTTALALKDPERTKALIKLSHEKESLGDRFSLLTLRQVLSVHEKFTPEELRYTELIPQNKESVLAKARAGRARDKDREPLVDASSIACVTGLLVNMHERKVRLVTPCASTERWPDGFHILHEATFASADHFTELIQGWYDALPISVKELPQVRFGPDLRLENCDDGFTVGGPLSQLKLSDATQVPYLQELGQLVKAGNLGAETIATILSYTHAKGEAQTLALLQLLYDRGALDEEPCCPLTTLEQFRPTSRQQLIELLTERNLPVRGVVHVGGHEAHELESYLSSGLNPILYCEPHPQTFRELEKHLNFWRSWFEVLSERYGMHAPRLLSVQKAIANHNNLAVFHRTLQEMCSSLLAPSHPQITPLDTVEVQCARLDEVMEEQGVSPTDVSFLNIDTQGADLMVLQGAPKLLEHVPLILIEVNYEERYQGCPLADEVDAYLRERGYHEVSRVHPPGYPAADALYSR